MYTDITPLQKNILEFVAECVQERGCPPTLREIGRRLRITSPSSVAYHLKVLESRGLLKREGSVSRGVQPLEHPFRLPILGRVGAGGGVIAQEDVEGHLTLDKDLIRGSEYLLRVRGDSMDRAGIIEGDLVQVRPAQSAENGEIVVALVAEQEEAVVKRLRKRGGAASLESANPAYRLIEGEFRVIGKVTGLIRSYGR